MDKSAPRKMSNEELERWVLENPSDLIRVRKCDNLVLGEMRVVDDHTIEVSPAMFSELRFEQEHQN